MVYDDIELDATAHRVRRAGKTVQLGPTEYRLLRHFMENPGRVFSRGRLLDAVWGHDPDIDERTVDVHVRRLRKALNGSDLPDVIRTVRSAAIRSMPKLDLVMKLQRDCRKGIAERRQRVCKAAAALLPGGPAAVASPSIAAIGAAG